MGIDYIKQIQFTMFYKTSYLLFFTGVFFWANLPVSYSKRIPCTKNDDLSETIDSEREQCCKGNVELLQKGKKCCYETGQFYFDNEMLCCNGTLSKRPSVGTISCCKGEAIDDNLFICCDSQKVKLPRGLKRKDASCCGHIPYNISKKFCCGNNHKSLHNKSDKVHCCGEEVIDKGTHWCDSGTKRLKYIVKCGNKEIDLQKQSCCDGVPTSQPYYTLPTVKNKHHGCCKTRPYNTSQSKCCPSGVTIPLHPDTDCCGQGHYNKSNEMCCHGNVIVRRLGDNQCCGTLSYNNKKNGCCSDQLYDLEKDQCCRGRHSQIYSKNTTCCGSSPLTDDKVCCYPGLLVTKTMIDDNKCCRKSEHKAVSYNSKNKGCHQGNLYSKGTDIPCGSKLMHKWQQQCCAGKIFWRYPDTECCGAKLRNVTDQICCRGKVLNVSPKHKQCCQGKVYKIDDLPVICRPKLRTMLEMCGDTEYHPKTFICCHGELVRKQDGNNATAETLCPNKNKGPITKNSNKCPSITSLTTLTVLTAFVFSIAFNSIQY